MNELDALREAITSEQFNKEPLAMAIMFYLNKTNPKAYKEILDLFDKAIDGRINRMINDYKDSDLEDL